jgi:hypothetical protein
MFFTRRSVVTHIPLRLENAPIASLQVETAPPRSRVIDRRHNGPPSDSAGEVHRGVYAVFVGFFVAMFGIYGLTFMGEKEALFSVVVSIVYTTVYITVPYVMWRVARAHGLPASDQSFATFMNSEIDTFTGPLAGWEAAGSALSSLSPSGCVDRENVPGIPRSMGDLSCILLSLR